MLTTRRPAASSVSPLPQLIGGVDPSAGAGQFSAGQAASGGIIVLHNLSPYELIIGLGNDIPGPNGFYLFAWQQKEIDLCGHAYSTVFYSIYTIPTAQPQAGAPSSWLVGEAYVHGATPAKSNPNYDRLGNLGNTVTTAGSGGTANIKNDGNAPATQILESTPNDQASSAENWANDASGTEQILSAGAQHIVRQNVRGNATSGKATVRFGDSVDLSITSFYGKLFGSLDTGVLVPVAQLTGSGTLPAGARLPGSQVTGDVAAGQIGPGALDADVTMAGAQVTGDLAAGQVGPGGLDSDVGLGGDPASDAWLPERLGVNLHGVSGNDGIESSGFTRLMALTGHNQAVNAYVDAAATWRHAAAGTSYLVSFDSNGLSLRTSTDATGAGGAITWGAAIAISNAAGYLTLDATAGGDVHPMVKAGFNFHVSDSAGKDLFWCGGGGISLQSGSTFKALSMFSGTTGTGSTAVNHGLGQVPAGVVILPNHSGTSYTVSGTNLTSTQVTLLIGAGIAVSFWGLAFA